MTYTLEINHINPRENLFFHNTEMCTTELMNAYIDPIVEKHIKKGSWVGDYNYHDKTMSITQRPTGEWQRIITVKNFISIEAASEFFNDLIADGPEIRVLLRAWQQENGILNETNILDTNGNIVEVIHACQAHKCMRFGSCPDQGQGCNVVGSTSKSNTYPIYHLTPISSKKSKFDLFSNGQYGLVDMYYRFVWINTFNEKMAHEIRQTFWPKAATVVFDLSFFENYSEGLIDSQVSLNWKIEPTNLLSPLTNISLSNSAINLTQKTYTSNILYNQPTPTLLSEDRKIELQNQMLFYLLMLKFIHWESKTFQDDEKELLNNIRQLFQTELHLSTIKEKLVDVVGKSITKPYCLATLILDFLDAKYE